jgi:hypothetical protein
MFRACSFARFPAIRRSLKTKEDFYFFYLKLARFYNKRATMLRRALWLRATARPVCAALSGTFAASCAPTVATRCGGAVARPAAVASTAAMWPLPPPAAALLVTSMRGAVDTTEVRKCNYFDDVFKQNGSSSTKSSALFKQRCIGWGPGAFDGFARRQIGPIGGNWVTGRFERPSATAACPLTLITGESGSGKTIEALLSVAPGGNDVGMYFLAEKVFDDFGELAKEKRDSLVHDTVLTLVKKMLTRTEFHAALDKPPTCTTPLTSGKETLVVIIDEVG